MPPDGLDKLVLAQNLNKKSPEIQFWVSGAFGVFVGLFYKLRTTSDPATLGGKIKPIIGGSETHSTRDFCIAAASLILTLIFVHYREKSK
jgi:hypothetical protein